MPTKGRGTIHRALQIGGRGVATPLPLATMRRPCVPIRQPPTALSFIGLGLKDPVSSLGVMLQKATSADVMLNYQWYFIPVAFFIVLVMAFVFVGDGLRDAADPYSEVNK